MIDQPRRGNAGRSTQASTLTPVADEQKWFNIFRVGIWPNFFPGVQFSRNPEVLNQYFRQMTPDTGPLDLNVTTDAVAELSNKIGPGILVTHSHSGGMGWRTAIKSQNVRAIVAYEPGSISSSRTAKCLLRCQAPTARWRLLAFLCRSS